MFNITLPQSRYHNFSKCIDLSAKKLSNITVFYMGIFIDSSSDNTEAAVSQLKMFIEEQAPYQI